MSTMRFSIPPRKSEYDGVQAVVQISTYGKGITLSSDKFSSESMSHFEERVSASARNHSYILKIC